MFAEIAIPNTTLDVLTYTIPDNLASDIRPGSLVKVELKKKKSFGIVIKTTKTTPLSYTKNILELLEINFIPDDLLQLLSWTQKYYFANWGQVLNLAIPKNVYQYMQNVNSAGDEIDYSTKPPTYEFSEFPAVRKIISSLKEHQYKTFVLFNPDNKESAEIYLRLIEESLRLNKSTIILVPEIILTPKFIVRFKERLVDNLLCLHSGLKLSERKQTWYKIRNRACSIVLGTRSAIFAPVNNLGLVIVDAEHDLSYKEKERRFHFHARDLAVMRAQQSKAVAVLASSTPTCESFYNAKCKKYELVSIPKSAHKVKDRVLLVDMRRSKTRIISPKLKYEIRAAYKKGRPVVLFLNRLGFSRVITCQDCGHIPLCPTCEIPLVLHREGKLFTCSLCKHREVAFDYCPQCKGNDFLYQGIGTQQVAADINKIFPKVEILRIDKDSAKLLNFKSPMAKLTSVLITTRLGIRDLDYSQLGLFGVVLADTTLFRSDFRAGEKTFQELNQIINQCKTNKDCKVIIQTYHPDNYAVYLAVQENYLKFFEQETALRRKLQYPPFTRLALITVSSPYSAVIEKISEHLEQKLQTIQNITVLGPTQIRPVKKKQQFAYQFLIKMPAGKSLSNFLSRQNFIYDKVDLDINIDPL
ncbi:MAG: primosomal protein N' [Candidatus Latescibacteria bacterium]|nr:primosomal protein N' [Candidatus Latescibacterota bacterium]